MEEYKKLTKNKAQFERDLEIFGTVLVEKRLKFSTGGMRGLLREGFNGINAVTCNILCTHLAKAYSSVVIGYDCRKQSAEFGMIAASIFKKHNKKVYLYEHIATPCLSFLVKHLDVDIGLMITASHNPKEYNGFKVYDAHGCQVSEPLDGEIEENLRNNETTNYSDAKIKISLEETKPSREEIILKYTENMFRGWKDSQMPTMQPSPLQKILFTPLFGVSIDFVKQALTYYGLIDLFDFVSSQCKYDCEFPGLPYPNPEVEQVYDEAKSYPHNIIFSCDPDGDRFGMVEKINGSYIHYCGDEIASIFIKYFIENFEHSSLVFINTYLCNDFMEDISKRFNIEYHRTKTGFKNVSKVINSVDKNKIIFAYEDSLGFFFGGGREKDGIKCTVLMAHILQNHSPSNILSSLKEYGNYTTFNYHYRCSNPKELLKNVIKRLTVRNLYDMFLIEREDHKLILRKSGTEPIIKIYGTSKVLNKKELEKKVLNFLEKNFK
ncbi:putative phosphoribomutase [Nosema granulosis]|uniref:Phosphoribomutase n=1 Tax=Nosema granulosis TaxID=83296 RepID=A0A9P6GXN4_9MICR|nr:putative phosphoribomutase [Nosema granulosis]